MLSSNALSAVALTVVTVFSKAVTLVNEESANADARFAVPNASLATSLAIVAFSVATDASSTPLLANSSAFFDCSLTIMSSLVVFSTTVEAALAVDNASSHLTIVVKTLSLSVDIITPESITPVSAVEAFDSALTIRASNPLAMDLASSAVVLAPLAVTVVVLSVLDNETICGIMPASTSLR